MTAQTVVYLLCLLASAGCAGLLVRSYLRTRTRLLLWTALGFVFFSLNNLLVVMDLVLLANADLIVWRLLVMVAAVAVMIYGFIWEAE